MIIIVFMKEIGDDFLNKVLDVFMVKVFFWLRLFFVVDGFKMLNKGGIVRFDFVIFDFIFFVV